MKTDMTVGACVFNKEKVLLIFHKKLQLWLPPGGHIEKDETPDDAVMREVLEETSLHVTLMNIPQIPIYGAVKTHLASPFYVNVHNVGDHDHIGFYYLTVISTTDEIEINEEEVTNFRWLSKDEIKKDPALTQEVKSLMVRAFNEYEKALQPY